MQAAGNAGGEGFYAYLSHGLMVAIFLPAFVLPLAIIALGLRDYWRDTGGRMPMAAELRSALIAVARLKNLASRMLGGTRIKRCYGASCCASWRRRSRLSCTMRSQDPRLTVC